MNQVGRRAPLSSLHQSVHNSAGPAAWHLEPVKFPTLVCAWKISSSRWARIMARAGCMRPTISAIRIVLPVPSPSASPPASRSSPPKPATPNPPPNADPPEVSCPSTPHISPLCERISPLWPISSAQPDCRIRPHEPPHANPFKARYLCAWIKTISSSRFFA